MYNVVLNKVIKRVAKELNLPEDLIKNTYMSYWKIVKDSIQSIPLKDINIDQIKEYKTSINIPSLGKLSCTLDKYKRIKDRYNYIKNLKHDIKDK